MKSNDYHRIGYQLYQTPWAITSEMYQTMVQVYEQHVAGHADIKSVYAQRRFDAQALELTAPRNSYSKVYRRGALAYVPVQGIIGNKLSLMEAMCGGYSLQQLRRDVDEIRGDTTVKRVLFDFDSPGGSISGLPETAALLAQLGKEKDTFGFTEGQCQSAAYWLMSQCNHLYATESSFAGSVGIYLAVYDRTQAMENEGVKLTLIKAGKHKGSGIPGNPLGPDEIAMLQKQVDMIYLANVNAITAKRPKVTSETMQGQSFYGRQILQAKLVDAMASGLGQLVTALS